ncbi:MAG TPA: DUF4465 domain-containing protein [Gemmatales bacterium]|nr:DUF4465 domain-containing protein [Gemmatales bacterium]
MKYVFTLAALTFFTVNLFAQGTMTIDFEDKTLPPNSFYNGSDNAGGFTSRGAFFNNSYGGGFWSGWSYSNTSDTTMPGFGNQYSAITGAGVGGGGIYGVAFNYASGASYINLPTVTQPLSVSITNTTYAALSMKFGDSFAKKFGGVTGNDPDFFLLTIQARSGLNGSGAILGAVPFYLADYRFADNSLDYIVKTWNIVDLSSLPVNTQSLTFDLTSSDNGPFGMNTPCYFALDSLVVAVPEPGTIILISSTIAGSYAVRRFQKRRAGPREQVSV